VKVLVLGGTRFIGAAAVRALVDRGAEVACFHRGRTAGDLPDGVVHLHGDRAVLAAHREALAAFGPDVALDMMAMTGDGARAVVEVLRGLVGRAVVASSCDVYRCFDAVHGRSPRVPAPADEDGPLRERPFPYRGDAPRADDDPERWKDDYDKLDVERAFLDAPDLPASVVRLPMVYGPGDYQRRTGAYQRRMAALPALLLGESLAGWRACRGYVDDVGGALALACARPEAAGRVYAVAEPDPPTEREWVEALGRTVGWTGEVRVVPDDALPEPLRAPGVDFGQDITVTSERLRRELGYAEAVPRDEALRRTAAWEAAHPPAEPQPSDAELEAERAALGAEAGP